MATKKEGAYAHVAALLQKFQERLDKCGARQDSVERSQTYIETELNDSRKKFSAAVTACQLAVRQVNEIAEKLSEQSTVNKEVAASLYNLRESTQKAFDRVKADVKSLLESQQRLNERVTKLEGFSAAQRDYEKVNSLETRVAAVENVIKAAKVLLGLVGKI